MKQCWQRLNVATVKWLSAKLKERTFVWDSEVRNKLIEPSESRMVSPAKLTALWLMAHRRYGGTKACQICHVQEASGRGGWCCGWHGDLQHMECHGGESRACCKWSLHSQGCGQEASGWMREVKDQRAEVGMSLGTCLMALLTDSI